MNSAIAALQPPGSAGAAAHADPVILGFLAEIAGIVDADRVLVMLYDFEHGSASGVVEWVRQGIPARGLHLSRVPLDRVPPAVREAHQRGEPYWIPDVAALPEGVARPQLEGAAILSALALPLMDRGVCFGFVGFDWTRAAQREDPSAQSHLKLFSALLANLLRRQQAEAVAHERESRLRSISENLADGLMYQLVIAADGTRRFTFLSGSVVRLYGVSAEQAIADARCIYGRVHPEDVAELTRLEAEAHFSMKTFRAEARVINPDGTVRWSSFSSTPRRLDDGSTVWDGVEFVITARKQAEEALRQNEERLRLALDATTDAIWDWDLTTQETFVGPRWYTMLGYSGGDSRADLKLARSLIHPDDLERVAAASDRAIAAGGSYMVEARMRCADGSWKWVQSRGSVSARDVTGRAVRISGTNSDIHARKVAEEERATMEAQFFQAQKIDSVGRLAGGVAHDFNNMLAVITACVESALEEATGERLRSDLEEIRAAAGRSADLTRQLLAFARKQTVAPVVLDLNPAVGRSLKMLERLIGEDIRIEWRPSPGAWPVRIDPSQVDQVVANLCVNARDAIRGSGRIAIETANVHVTAQQAAMQGGWMAGDYVVLTVTDDGVGMDKATLAMVFEPFFTTKEVGKGTGLGLATVYGIVKQNGGFISVTSQPGGGTTFCVYLPRHGESPAGLPPSSVPELVRGEVGPAPSGVTVLLVEDEPTLLAITGRMLRAIGYVVLTASTPDDALRLSEARREPIDVLLSDVVMPGMNGQQLAEALARTRPGLKCLFMSGYTADVIATHGVLDAGVHFLQKPFTRHELAARVRAVLGV